jgi:hypothetical protein
MAFKFWGTTNGIVFSSKVGVGIYHLRGAYHPSEERKGVKSGRFNPRTLASSSFAALLLSSFPFSRLSANKQLSDRLWESLEVLNVRDGIHAGEVSFLSSMWFGCGPEI